MILSIEIAALGAVAYCGRAKKWPCLFVNYQTDTCYKSSIPGYPAYAFTLEDSMAGLA